jgi:clan AA aspartic protease (TIGR02281 family)
MPSSRKVTFTVIGSLVLALSVLTWHQAQAEMSPPPAVGEETRQVQSDFALGGVRRLNVNWSKCVQQARISQDANAAERCVIYGYGALLVIGSGETFDSTPWMRNMTTEGLGPGQTEMLAIMGIPEGPRQAWLDRYRRWVLEGYSADKANPPDNGYTPVKGYPSSFGSLPPVFSDGGTREPQADLAKAAEGQSPAEALRQPDISAALRNLLGQQLYARLKDYGFGGPMAFNGRFTVGKACVPRDCGMSEVRYVFSSDEVWVAIVEGRRMRIYGNPPRQVRALLLRERNQVAWRGGIEDVTHPVQPPVLPVSVDPAPRQASVDGDTTEIRLRKRDGTLVVPVLINNTMTVPFTIDSGASDVSISTDILNKLMQSGSISRADFLGKQTYHLADGSTVASETFRIHSLKVGDREVRDVTGSVTNDTDGLLLGQSFLTRFRSWSIDNQRQVLLLK